MNKKILTALLISISLLATSCGNSKTEPTTSNPQTEDSTSIVDDSTKEEKSSDNTNTENVDKNSTPTESKSETPEETKYQIINKNITEGKIKINYPEVSGLKDANKQNAINELIKNELIKMENNFTSTNPDVSIEVNYKVSLANANLLSIKYSGLLTAPTAAHPSILFYTSNININSASKVKLSDVVTVDKNLIQKFKEGTYVADNYNEEVKSAVVKYLNDLYTNGFLSEDELIKEFNLADDFTTEIPSQIFSYFTEDSIGISIPTNHALGEHAEFEIKYSAISQNIKHENDIWKGLLK